MELLNCQLRSSIENCPPRVCARSIDTAGTVTTLIVIRAKSTCEISTPIRGSGPIQLAELELHANIASLKKIVK